MKAQQSTKLFADQHRIERTFKVGDWDFLKLQLYKQQSVAVRKSFKLAVKFYGPFEIEERIGEVAYKLKLPLGAKILYPMIHASLMKKRIGASQQITPTLPQFNLQDQCPLEPELILKKGVIMRNGNPVVKYLIKWEQLAIDEASWEDKDFIQHQFQVSSLEVKAYFEE